MHYLVMELAEGETLSERLSRGPMAVDEALPVALRISEALEAAHERGIIHRDLKPANVTITPAGEVKVLDFGLAKALEGEPGGPGEAVATQSPTLTAQMTGAGVILGTAAYMSPEQARGLDVDRRADVWAFGCVLYEMLSGRRSFDEETVTDTLAAVLKSDIEFERLPADTPPSIRRLLERCLDKKERTRLRDIGEARVRIERYLADPEAETAAPEREADPAGTVARRGGGLRSAIAWGVAAAALALAAAAWWLPRASTGPELPVVRTAVLLTDAEIGSTVGSQVALSPTEPLMVYQASAEGVTRLHVRRFDQLADQPLSGTEGARDPFFSPDGEWIGFFADGKLKKVAVLGGSPLELTAARNDRGGAWSEDGTIYYTKTVTSGISAIPAAGGEPREVTERTEEERSHRWPHLLPGGRTLLMTVQFRGANFNEANIEAVDLASGERKVIARGGSYPVYTPSGHLLYTREGTVFAAPFDPETLELGRTPAPVLQDVTFAANNGGAQLAVSRDLLVHRRGQASGDRVQPVLVAPGEEPVPLLDQVADYFSLRASPDGSRVAFSIDDNGSADLWLLEVARGALSRFTFHESEDFAPVWSPDGRWIAFASVRDGSPNLYRKPADGSGETERLLVSDVPQFPDSWSPDGRYLLFRELGDDTQSDILRLDLENPEAEPEALVRGEQNECCGIVSPDGRWLAYGSEESGRWEVYVRPFDPAGGKWQVSTDGGSWPRWSDDGERLFFQRDDGSVWSAAMELGESAVGVAVPEVVIEAANWHSSGFLARYDTMGTRFLLLQEAASEGKESPERLVLVTNWLRELERLIPSR